MKASNSGSYLFQSKSKNTKKSNISVAEQSRLKIDQLRKDTMGLQDQFKFDQKSRKLLKPSESKIHELQNNAAMIAQNLQIQLQKERYYAKEIEDLKAQIEERREFGKQFNNDPKNLKKEIEDVKKQYAKNVQTMNETKANNRQLRIKINNMRKERTIFDGIYTKLEKDILQKENKLLRLLEKQERMEKSLEKKKERNQQYHEHAQREQDRFESNYSQIIQGITSNKQDRNDNSIISNPEDLLERKRENNAGDNRKDYFEESDVIEEINHQHSGRNTRKEDSEHIEDVKRFKELEDLNEKFKKLTLLTQETDFSYVSKMYNNGKQINEKLFTEIQDLEKKLENVKEEKEKLTKDILAEKRGLNEEGQEIFNEIQEQENVLFKLREERKKVESKAEKRKVQLENLEYLMDNLEQILKMPPETEEEQKMNIGRSRNYRLLKIEQRATEAIFISDNYHEEDKGIVKESKALLRRVPDKDEKDKMLDIGDINNSIVDTNRDRENLIVETLPEVRDSIHEIVDGKLGIERPAPQQRKQKNRNMTKRLTRLR